MGWNDERVELLKKLWSEGLSASQIAGRLGSVTRNAVIGKVHRLGLSGRATTSRMKSHRPRARVAQQQQPKRLAKPRFPSQGNPDRARALPARRRAVRADGRGTRHSAQGAPHHRDAERSATAAGRSAIRRWRISISAIATRCRACPTASSTPAARSSRRSRAAATCASRVDISPAYIPARWQDRADRRLSAY